MGSARSRRHERCATAHRTSTHRRDRRHRGIEGWFTFGSAGYRLDIITPGLLAQATHEDWTHGSVLRADRAAWFSADWLLVPADTLDDELIAEAITRWYRERFKYQRGHWSHLEGRLPAVEINLAWEHPHKL